MPLCLLLCNVNTLDCALRTRIQVRLEDNATQNCVHDIQYFDIISNYMLNMMHMNFLRRN
jgi:hypothetical protein